MKCRNGEAEWRDEPNFTLCGYCGERHVRKRKKKDEIKIPTPRKRGQKWYVDLRREGVTVIEDTEAEAKAAAATRKNTGERGQGELSFSLPGDPRLAAEGRLSINLRPGIPTDWRIKRVEHRLDAQGYTTQVECERFTAAPVPITQSE